MKISETLGLIIEVAESGRAGAAVEIVRAVKLAIDISNRDDFFQGIPVDEIITMAQIAAVERENVRKNTPKIQQVEESNDEPDSAA